MKLAIRLAVMAVTAGALVGCGGAKIGSKEEAARVVFGAGEKGQAAQTQGALAQLYQSGVTSTGSVSVECSHGGTAEATFNMDGTDTLATMSFTMKFNGCTEPAYDDPSTAAVEHEDVTYDGQLTMTMDMSGTTTGASMVMTYKGRLNLSGAISDFVDADITETVLMDTTSSSATMQFTLNGTIQTSTDSYTYANETYTVTAEGQVVHSDA